MQITRRKSALVEHDEESVLERGAPRAATRMRVLKWIVDRCEGRGGAEESPIGSVPRAEDLDLYGLEGASSERMRELLAVKPEEWARELKGQQEFFKTLDPYLPNELLEELQKLGQRLSR